MLSHGWVQLAPFLWDDSRETLHRTETVASGQAITLEIRWDDALLVSSRQNLKPFHSELEKKLRRMFQLDVDLREFHALCRELDSHRGIAKTGFGRLLCGSSIFEDAVKVICTTNTTWSQTRRMVGLLVERCGETAPDGSKGFPVPQAIASLTPEVLKSDCRLGYRSTYVHALASGAADGNILLEQLPDPSLPSPELFDRFRELPGIGPYGAAHLLAMQGRHDFIAVDTEFRRFVREKWHGGRRVLDSTMLRRYSKWGRWQYLAYWSELWHSAR